MSSTRDSAWPLGADPDIALAGRNLPHPRHAEFGTAGSEPIARTVFASAALRF